MPEEDNFWLYEARSAMRYYPNTRILSIETISQVHCQNATGGPPNTNYTRRDRDGGPYTGILSKQC